MRSGWVLPESVFPALCLELLTALKEPSGGTRGIVVGDVFRRLVARTLAQQFAKVEEVATAPFQLPSALGQDASASLMTSSR